MIDSAVRSWLVSYKDAMQPPYRGEIPGLQSTFADQELSSAFAQLDGSASLYAWATMWLIHASLFSVLKIPITGKRLGSHLDKISPSISIGTDSALGLVKFFQFSGVDAGLDDELWSRFKGAKLLDRKSTARDELLSFFVMLAANRFEFSYAKIGRILLAMRDGDDTTSAALIHFEDADCRGAASFLAKVSRCVGFSFDRDAPGKAVRSTLLWFSSSRSREPTDRWRSARESVASSISEKTVRELSTWVRSRPNSRYFGDKPYRDDLFWLLWKSASWELGIRP